jgi:hypothetical protein
MEFVMTPLKSVINISDVDVLVALGSPVKVVMISGALERTLPPFAIFVKTKVPYFLTLYISN